VAATVRHSQRLPALLQRAPGDEILPTSVSYPVTCFQPSNSAGDYGQSLLFNIGVVTPMPGHVLGCRLSCTRDQVKSSMSNSSTVLRFFCLFAKYHAFMEWSSGQQGRWSLILILSPTFWKIKFFFGSIFIFAFCCLDPMGGGS
jgi:hypothetical protein